MVQKNSDFCSDKECQECKHKDICQDLQSQGLGIESIMQIDFDVFCIIRKTENFIEALPMIKEVLGKVSTEAIGLLLITLSRAIDNPKLRELIRTSRCKFTTKGVREAFKEGQNPKDVILKLMEDLGLDGTVIEMDKEIEL